MKKTSTDSIQKEITLSAPLSRVWRALTDATEFGTWFGVRLEGQFRVGEEIRGPITHPECKNMTFVAWVERMEPETSFAFRWCPTAGDPEGAKPGDPTTLVEFRLEQTDGGTRLSLTESGFDGLPADRRGDAFLRNERGWTGQMENIRHHVDG